MIFARLKPRDLLTIHRRTMASVQYSTSPGTAQKMLRDLHYAEAVRIPGTPPVKFSGKGGWDSQNFEMAEGDVNGQIELAFKNVDIALKHAGLKGWENVYLIRTYHTDIDSSIKQIAEATRRWCPDNTPVWTAIGVAKLGNPKMLIEVEVEAYDDSGKW